MFTFICKHITLKIKKNTQKMGQTQYFFMALKKGKPMKTKQEKEFFAQTILEASLVLSKVGWSVAIPQDGEIDHLVVGTKEALDNILSALPGVYDVMEKEVN